MADAVDFPQANFTWRGWPADENRDAVNDLRVAIDREGQESVSCWKLSWRERWAVFRGGFVWVRVLGQHPPLLVEGQDPFVEDGAPDLQEAAP